MRAHPARLPRAARPAIDGHEACARARLSARSVTDCACPGRRAHGRIRGSHAPEGAPWAPRRSASPSTRCSPTSTSRSARCSSASSPDARVRRRRDRVRRADEGVVGPALAPTRQPLPLRPARGADRAPDRLAAAPREHGAHLGSTARRCASTPPSRSRPGRGRSRTSTGCCRRCSRSSTRSRHPPRGPARRQARRRPELQASRSRSVTRGSRSRASTGGPDFWSSIGGATRRRSTSSSSSPATRARRRARPRGARADAAHARHRRGPGERSRTSTAQRHGARRGGRAGPGGVGRAGRRAGCGWPRATRTAGS